LSIVAASGRLRRSCVIRRHALQRRASGSIGSVGRRFNWA
jgi:hypothetical protein